MSRLRAFPGPEPARNLDNANPTVIACADPVALSAFWCAALGYVADPGGEAGVIVDPSGSGPRVRFGPAPATERGQPRLELAVTGSGPFVRHQALVEAEVGRLVGLGARVVGRAQGGRYAVVLTDPEGNEFCVG